MNIEIKEIEISKKTICLNMIVKDESKIIEDTLNNLSEYFDFSYWLICDTGSQDNTKDIIQQFFKNKGISGEILDHKWRDFAHNRTLALDAVHNKTDYVLIADADDRIYGNLEIPKLKCDKYNLKFGKDFTYYRPILINNRLKSGWCFKGVVHEFLSNKDPKQTIKEETIKGDYYFGIGTFGARSNDPDKYFKDAQILEKAFEEEQDDQGMRARYAFYCAQSFMDAKIPEKAIKWYLKVLELNNWNQEKYYACLKLGQLYQGLGKDDAAVNIWSQSYKYDSDRLDCIASLMSYYYNKGNHLLVNSLHNKYKNKIKDIKKDIKKDKNSLELKSKLFLDTEAVYKFDYYNSISAYYVDDLLGGYDSCKKLIINKKYLDISIKNMKFYFDQLKKDKNNMELFSVIEDIRNNIVKNEINTANISFVDIDEIWNIIFTNLY